MTNELLLYLLLLEDEKHLLSLHLQCLALGECSLNECIIFKYCLLHANRYLHLSLPKSHFPACTQTHVSLESSERKRSLRWAHLCVWKIPQMHFLVQITPPYPHQLQLRRQAREKRMEE